MISKEWYALQVYTGREKWVSSYLQQNGHETLLPVSVVISKWSDRQKRIERPVFPGYVFCHFDATRRAPILSVPGVLSIVGRARTPVPIEAHEIAALQKIQKTGYRVETCPYLDTGTWVTIEGGSLDGVIGRLVELKKRYRVMLSVSLLQRSVCLEVDQERLRPIDVKCAQTTIKLTSRHACEVGESA